MREIPLREQYLWIEGKVSESSFELIKSGLSIGKPSNAEILFIGYAYDDIPLGKTFQVIFPKESPQKAVFKRSRIAAVTQQFGKPLDVIPQGWKTICIIEFLEGVPDIIANLPTINSWGENRNYVCLSDEEAFYCIQREATAMSGKK